MVKAPTYTLQELKDWHIRLLQDLMADDFNDVLDKIRFEADKLFKSDPNLDTAENRDYFGMK